MEWPLLWRYKALYCSGSKYLVTIVVAIVGTLICLTITKLITPIRVSKKDELIGLDKSEHSETAYPSFNGFD